MAINKSFFVREPGIRGNLWKIRIITLPHEIASLREMPGKRNNLNSSLVMRKFGPACHPASALNLNNISLNII